MYFTESVPVVYYHGDDVPFTFSITEGIALGFYVVLHHESMHRALARSEPVCGGGRSSVCTEDYSGGLVTGEGFQIS
mgnify:CR=1 FL=1